MTPLDFRNTNSLWCSVIAETLVRTGVRRVVLSPGSRSTPLVFAFSRHPQIECIPVLDERSAAFFALGLAKRLQDPVVLLCTSGTAVANYLPAVIEAHESRTPLLILSADRPPELRECHSGQTIDQLKIFGGFVRLQQELMVPAAELGLLRALRQMVAQAVAQALGPEPGAVHLNCPFRDPLAPFEDGSSKHLAVCLEPAEALFEELRPAFATRAALAAGADSLLVKDWFVRGIGKRGLLVVGPDFPCGAAKQEEATFCLRALASRLGCPVLVDGVSPLRHLALEEVVRIAHYDAILRSAQLASRLRPDWVVCIGGWPTSKVLRSWLQHTDPRILFASASSRNRDGLHGRTLHIPQGALFTFTPAEKSGLMQVPDWLCAWQTVERAAAASLEQSFELIRDITEPKTSHRLGQLLPTGTPLFVASSMPVRDVEYFWPASDRRHRLYHNRGANGIDGTLSTAFGIAHGEGNHAVLLTGDLSFLHDSNGLLLHRRLRGALTVVLINNRGGGIFEHLPVAGFEGTFEEFFATPQEVDFARLCAAHGIEHATVADWEHFERCLGGARPSRGVRVLEIVTDRKRDAALRRSLLQEAAEAALAALGPSE